MRAGRVSQSPAREVGLGTLGDTARLGLVFTVPKSAQLECVTLKLYSIMIELTDLLRMYAVDSKIARVV